MDHVTEPAARAVTAEPRPTLSGGSDAVASIEHRIGVQSDSGRRTVLSLVGGSVVLLIVAMVTILVAGLAFWRSSDPAPAESAAQSYTGALGEPLRIVPVRSVTPGGCKGSGTPGRTADDGCFTLGSGGMTVTMVERVNTALRDGRWLVEVRFSSADTVAFRALTSQHVGKRLALVLGRTVLAAPEVSQTISAGKVQIVGAFTKKDVDAIFTELTTH
ncbi:SecDF P1 head subdomain-containing protein [Cryptosporangium minutisporangium]|uniref:SecDF P1 head subdomain-containing protein n=1 Tax=Cryptosporangium minutisporangium TaxID=113569 RepID=UPI0031EB7F27